MDMTPSSWIVINVKSYIHLSAYQWEQDLTSCFFFPLKYFIVSKGNRQKKSNITYLQCTKERIVKTKREHHVYYMFDMQALFP